VTAKVQMGFKNRVRLEWLDQTAELVLAGKSPAEVRQLLDSFLADKLSVGGQAEAGNRSIVIGICYKIWVKPPQPLLSLNKDGLKLINRLSLSERLPIHWGMSMAAYPFVGQVGAIVGKLLQLQGTITTAQIIRRVQEQLGTSEAISRATRRMVSNFVDWGVLQDTEKAGELEAASKVEITDPQIIGWLLEAALLASGAQVQTLSTLTNNPSLFPFKLAEPIAQVIETNPRLEVLYHSLNQSLVTLRSA